MGDQLPEHATSAWQRADALAFCPVDADRQKTLQFGARVAEHAQRRVASTGQFAGGVEHSIEHHLEVELGEHATGDVEYPLGSPIHYQRARFMECGLTNDSKSSSLTSPVSYDRLSNDPTDGLRNVLRLATAHIPMYSCVPLYPTSGLVSLPQNSHYFV